MESNKDKIQNAFIARLKDLIPQNISLVDELMDLLDISMDSAYRRIRSETALTIDEVHMLCRHYNISFDSMSDIDSGSVTFKYKPIESDEKRMEEYLDELKLNLDNVARLKDSNVFYACRDLPLFYHFKFPLLASFKMYYWMKSIMNVPSFQAIKFDNEIISDHIIEKGQELFKSYVKISSSEIWTEGILDSFLKQIEYAHDAGFFNDSEKATELCDLLLQELGHMRMQADMKAKFTDEVRKFENSDNFNLYMSEIEIGNNTIFVSSGDFANVFITHQGFNTMQTGNNSFVAETKSWIDSLVSKSTLISGVSEKQRNLFFNKISSKISDLKSRLEKK